MRARREGGFTLVEVMVVVLIVALLAAIAVPVFTRQTDNADAAHSRSMLKDAAIAIDSYATQADGDYSGLDGADSGPPPNAAYDALVDEGFRKSPAVRVSVAADRRTYCITAVNGDLEAAHAWYRSTYNSVDGYPSPTDADAC